MRKHFLTVSILFTLILLLLSIMYAPPVLFEKYRDELFFTAGALLVFSIIRKEKTKSD